MRFPFTSYNNPTCHRCESIDTITHYFFSCVEVRSFWEIFFRYINLKTHPRQFQCNRHNIMFGFPQGPAVINLLILLAKQYLHFRKRQSQFISFDAYLSYVNGVRDAEKLTATIEDKMETFATK